MDRRELLTAVAAAVAAIAAGETVMSQTNPNWNITQAAANEMGRAAATLDSLVEKIRGDRRYSGEIDTFMQAAQGCRRAQQLVTDYLLVQGT
jgi:hypothetical protein